MNSPLTNEEQTRVKLAPIKNGTRECWITVLHDTYLNIDVLIGAGTKEACMKAFALYSKDARCSESLVYHAVLSKAKEEPVSALERTP